MRFFSLISDLIEYILMICIVLDCNTPYAYALNKNYYLTEIIIICILALYFISILRYKIKRNTFEKWLIVFTPYYIIMILYFFINVSEERWINFVIRFLIGIPILTIIFCIYHQNGNLFKLLKKFSLLMFWLSIVSLFFWWFGSQLRLISPTGIITSYWGIEFNYPSYYGVYFERQTDNFLWISGFRNIGIFCEGPMFSLCLVFTLFTELFLCEINKQKSIYKKDNKIYLRINTSMLKYRIRILVLTITLFTTTSTTGMIIFIFMIIIKYLFIGTKDNIKRIFKWIFGIVIVILGFYLINVLFVNKSQSNSWLIRMDDFYIGIKAWMKSPIFGNGYGEWSTLQSLMNSSLRTNTGFSNAIFTVLSQGGCALFLVYLVPIIGYFVYAVRNRDRKIFVFGTVFFIEFIVTLFQYTFLMLLFLSVGYALIVSDNMRLKVKI